LEKPRHRAKYLLLWRSRFDGWLCLRRVTAGAHLVRHRYAECGHLREFTRTQWLAGNAPTLGGETPVQIFKSAALNNASALNLGREIGTVQVGKRADLLLLRQDPTQTIEAYAAIVKVILNGRVLEASQLVAI
jgi:adenine deaminase